MNIKSPHPKRKRIILILCEGESDRAAFDIFQLYINLLDIPKTKKPQIEIISTDGDKLTAMKEGDQGPIFLKDSQCLNNLSSAIKDKLTKLCIERKITLDDIDRVLMVTDMDGCYIENDDIYSTTTHNSNLYYDEEEGIITESERHKIQIECRNRQKRNNIEFFLDDTDLQLITNSERKRKQLYLYFMSCNLDHVIANNANNTDKVDIARRWKNKLAFNQSPDEIVEYFSELCPTGLDYEKTWSYIKERHSLRSIKRSTNCALIIDTINKYINQN